MSELPGWAAGLIGVGLLALVAVLMGTLWWIGAPKLRDPEARERAKRGGASRKRQRKLRARRVALQRKAARRSAAQARDAERRAEGRSRRMDEAK